MAENAKATASSKDSRKGLYTLVSIGLMAALVYVGNYFQIKIPNGGLVTRIHLGNSMCLLAGLLFGSVSGGLASGIGAGLYDLFDPVYIVSAPYTFFSKFAMGFTAGWLRKHGSDSKKAVIGAAAAGQIVYIVLYLLKTFVSQILLGEPVEVALKLTGVNAITSTVNAVLAVVISVPLYFALAAALKRTGFGVMIAKKEEKKGWVNPLTAVLTAVAIIGTALYGISLANSTKLEKKQEEKEKAYIDEIDRLNNKIDYLYEQLGIEPPAEEESEEETE